MIYTASEDKFKMVLNIILIMNTGLRLYKIKKSQL